MLNFERKKMRYLPGLVDPQKKSQNLKKCIRKWVPCPPVRPSGGPGGAAPREEEKGGSGGQRPPGNILVFRMFHILVGATACVLNTKMVITRLIWGPPGQYFGMHLSTILSNIFLSPKVFVFNKIKQFLKVFGGS